jgi:SAM-dependent methyltransferase
MTRRYDDPKDPQAPKDPHAPAMPVAVPSKRRIAHSFGRKAATYRKHAVVQAELIGRIVRLIADFEAVGGNGLLLDAGCGTGLLAELCREARLQSRIVGIDLAGAALAAEERIIGGPPAHLAADMERLPFKPQTFRGAIAASVFQWLDSPLAALGEIADVLEPGGFLIFSVFVEGSFAEVLATRATFGLPSPVRCPEPDAFAASLHAAGFERVTFATVARTVFATNAATHLKSISAIGGSAAAGQLLTRGRVVAFCRAYEERFRKSEGVPLTYRTMVGSCVKGQ